MRPMISILIPFGLALAACNAPPVESCGDGLCTAGAGESCASCAADCGSCDAGTSSPDGGGDPCGIVAGRWTGTSVPDPSSTDPMCTPQSFDMSLTESFFAEYAELGTCPTGCTCTPSGTPVPPTCNVGTSVECGATSATESWFRVSATEIQTNTYQNGDRGWCGATWTITRTGP